MLTAGAREIALLQICVKAILVDLLSHLGYERQLGYWTVTLQFSTIHLWLFSEQVMMAAFMAADLQPDRYLLIIVVKTGAGVGAQSWIIILGTGFKSHVFDVTAFKKFNTSDSAAGWNSVSSHRLLVELRTGHLHPPEGPGVCSE